MKHHSFIDSLPQMLGSNEADVRPLAQSNILLQKLSEAFFQLNDTITGNEILKTMERIEAVAVEKEAGPDILSNISLWKYIEFMDKSAGT
ncbi:MAG: hypothetical protein KL787_06250 [Taibaiella sp.]|nr:hypothetical protein [Taibaiella sp.]